MALPYLASSRLSSDPAFTPIRIGTPASAAALAISPTLSSKALMLPGLTRTAAQPASIAANTYLGWKWMSAMTGIWDFFAIAGNASASSWDGHRHPDDVAPGCGQLGDLLQRGVDVGGQRGGHGLHRYRRAAADEDRADPNLPGGSARGRERVAVLVGMPREIELTRPVSAFVRGGCRHPPSVTGFTMSA